MDVIFPRHKSTGLAGCAFGCGTRKGCEVNECKRHSRIWSTRFLPYRYKYQSVVDVVVVRVLMLYVALHLHGSKCPGECATHKHTYKTHISPISSPHHARPLIVRALLLRRRRRRVLSGSSPHATAIYERARALARAYFCNLKCPHAKLCPLRGAAWRGFHGKPGLES